MRVLAVFTAALASASAVFAASSTASYDATYDKAGLSTNNLACSDGSHGLRTRGYKNIGQLPTYPFVGGAPTIAGWNSPNCGACYRVTYKGKTIKYTAIDKANGFNMGVTAMNKLTGGRAKEVGRVNVLYEQIAAKECGL